MAQKYAAYSPATGAILAFYDAVDSPPPAEAITLAISDAEWQSCIATPGYTVAGGALRAPLPPTAAELLAAARAHGLAILSAACRAAIVGGFSSSALGSPHSYPSAPTDQQNLVDAIAESLAPGTPSNWETPLWCAAGNVWTFAAHSADQARAVHSDWVAFRAAQQRKLAALVAQLNAAATPAAAGLIVWS